MRLSEVGSCDHGVSTVDLLVDITASNGSALLLCSSSTLFWAGDTFAPKLKIKHPKTGVETPVQQFLQNAMLDMWAQVARAVGDLPGVLGFEVCPH